MIVILLLLLIYRDLQTYNAKFVTVIILIL